MLSFDYQNKSVLLALGLATSTLIAYLTVNFGFFAPMVAMTLAAVAVFLVIVFKNPIIGLITTLIYCFVIGFLARELPAGIPFGYLVEGLYAVVWAAIIFKTQKGNWSRINNDLCLLFVLWFIISILQLMNPNASARGWLSEVRSSGLDSFLLIPAGFLIFRNNKHLNIFLGVILFFSLVATLNGMKQLHIGLFPGEQAFLAANPTHMIWGQLRVFSFYRDAGQFGASQAHLSLIAGILALGPFKIWKRLVFLSLSVLLFYGMLISGTRGSFFVLIPGALLAIFLFKNAKILILGLLSLISFVAVLKYTYIGSGFSYVHRLRTALNPEDASLNARFDTQEILTEYLKDYPFGGGLGTLGYAGEQYNPGTFLSTIPPDSYWVKVWAMYGIVGFTFWFCMMMYILGKCCGIVWNIKDEKLRIKLIALTAGFCGIFVSSYGNEVINTLPSSVIVYLSLALIFMGPELDKRQMNKQELTT